MRRCSAAPVARGRPKTTRDACIAARLVVGEHQDEDRAAASRGSRNSKSVWGPCLCFLLSLRLSVGTTHWKCRARRCGAPCTKNLQARCFKPVRAPRLTAETCLARLNFCSDVLQRVGVLSIRSKQHLKPSDLTRVVFSDEKFFRWNYTGPAQNNPPPVMDQLTCTRFFLVSFDPS